MISILGPRASRGLIVPMRALIRATLVLEGARPGEIGLVLAGDLELRDLNRRWRGHDRAPDVLSFPYGDAWGKSGISGDLVISIDRAIQQAPRYRVSLGRELARLTIHGTLHLVGHDHHRAVERQRMRSAERRAMRAARDTIAALDAAFRRAG